MTYRPDIEGLRAVAILLVVAAHAGVPWLAGGFIGVDVFFVLSGYLITCLLTNELTRTGRVQFARFSNAVFRALQASAFGFDNVRVVDMTNAICPSGTCSAQRDGNLTYRDGRHLTASFVTSLAPALAVELNQ